MRLSPDAETKKGGPVSPPFSLLPWMAAYAAWLTWAGKTSSMRR